MIWLVGAGVVGLVLWLVRPMYRDYRLGVFLSKLSSIAEQTEANRLIGVNPEDAPWRTRYLIDQEFERGVAYFRQYPPERITRELLKNSMIAASMGRHLREQAIIKLIEALATAGVAMHVHDFRQSEFIARHGG